jgi:hypothetical protein
MNNEAAAKITTKLTNVETGYAVVVNADTNRRIGTVARDFMSGSSRSTEMWVASAGRFFKSTGHTTRTEAVNALVAHLEAKAAERAAFIARYS